MARSTALPISSRLQRTRASSILRTSSCGALYGIRVMDLHLLPGTAFWEPVPAAAPRQAGEVPSATMQRRSCSASIAGSAWERSPDCVPSQLPDALLK